jgi:phage host-nuclease inhibitor protein Gam
MSEEQVKYTPATLDEYLDGETHPEIDAEQGLKLATQMEADWALRHVAGIEADEQRDERTAELAHYQIDAWLTRQKEGYADNRGFFTRGLAAYLHRNLVGKKKSLSLPHGTIGAKAMQPEISKDNDALLQWVKDAGLAEFVKTKTVETVDWAGLKACLDLKGNEAVFVRQLPFDPVGEVVPCVSVSQKPDEFYVKALAPIAPFGPREIMASAENALPQPVYDTPSDDVPPLDITE